jgi:hypothetical protein
MEPADAPRPPEPRLPRTPDGPRPQPIDGDPVVIDGPSLPIPDETRPRKEPSLFPHRQDYSPDDRDALSDTDDPAFVPSRQDYSPDDRDALSDTGDPAFVPSRQDYSPDDRHALDNPVETPDLPWAVPEIPQFGMPDLRAPLDAPADPLHGDPVAELEWAQVQSENGYCVPVSVAMVVSELTGTLHGELELVNRALELGVLYGEPGNWLGMTAEGAVALIRSYGLDAEVEYGSVDTLRDFLDEGRDIILMVDADEIWYGDDDANPADVGMDHALVITAIDDATGIVYLNDPGQPEGPGFELSVTALNDAWADGGHQLVVTEVVPAPLGQAVREGAEAPVEAGFVLLPVVIAADVLRRVTPWARQTGDEAGA